MSERADFEAYVAARRSALVDDVAQRLGRERAERVVDDALARAEKRWPGPESEQRPDDVIAAALARAERQATAPGPRRGHRYAAIAVALVAAGALAVGVVPRLTQPEPKPPSPSTPSGVITTRAIDPTASATGDPDVISLVGRLAATTPLGPPITRRPALVKQRGAAVLLLPGAAPLTLAATAPPAGAGWLRPVAGGWLVTWLDDREADPRVRLVTTDGRPVTIPTTSSWYAVNPEGTAVAVTRGEAEHTTVSTYTLPGLAPQESVQLGGIGWQVVGWDVNGVALLDRGVLGDSQAGQGARRWTPGRPVTAAAQSARLLSAFGARRDLAWADPIDQDGTKVTCRPLVKPRNTDAEVACLSPVGPANPSGTAVITSRFDRLPGRQEYEVFDPDRRTSRPLTRLSELLYFTIIGWEDDTSLIVLVGDAQGAHATVRVDTARDTLERVTGDPLALSDRG